MKILLAAGLFPPDIGGPATYAELIAHELPKRGIDVDVVPYSRVRGMSKIWRHIVYGYVLWQRSRFVDAIFALDPMSVGVPARIVAFLRRKPFLLRLGGDYVWEQSVQRFGVSETLDDYTAHALPRSWKVWLLATIQTWVAKGAVTVIVPSQYLKKIVATWGVPESHIAVVYSAVTPPVIVAEKATLKAELYLTQPTIVSIGRLIPWKGFRTLIDVMTLRSKQGDNLRLVIGGDGPDRALLETYARDKGVSSSILFTGSLSQVDVFRYVKAADIFVLNTAYEGLSHQLLEVMALGTPIITTPIGGNPELITDGVEGLFVSVDDALGYDRAISKLFTHPELPKALVAAALKKSATFNPENSLLDLERILRQSVQ